MPKKIIYIAVGILIALIILSFAKDAIVKISVEKGVNMVTGMKLSIKSFRVGILRTLVHVKGLKLYNPKGYKDKLMMDMSEVYVNYDLPAFLEGKVHLYELRINLKELLIVKNREGELNVDLLTFVKDEKGKAPEGEGKLPEVQIDNFRLIADRVVYKDYSRGKKPSVTEYNVDLDQEYHDINDFRKLIMLIVAKTMSDTSVAQLSGFDLRSLEKALNNVVPGAGDAVNGTVDTLKNATKGLMSPFGAKEE